MDEWNVSTPDWVYTDPEVQQLKTICAETYGPGLPKIWHPTEHTYAVFLPELVQQG